MSTTATTDSRPRRGRPSATQPAPAGNLAPAGAKAAAQPSPAIAVATPPEPIPTYMLDDPDLAYDFAPGETTAPVIRLLQTKKPQKGDFNSVPAGHFVNMNTGEDLGSCLHVSVLGVLRTRVLMRPFAEAQQHRGSGGILCRSFDGATGEGAPGGSCETCPLGQFSETGAPRCVFSFNYAILPLRVGEGAIHDRDLGVGEFPTTALLRLNKKALGEARKWNKALHDYRPGFASVFRLEVAKVANSYDPNDPLFVPAATPVHRIRERAILESLYALAKSTGAGRHPDLRAAIEREEAAETAEGADARDEGELPF